MSNDLTQQPKAGVPAHINAEGGFLKDDQGLLSIPITKLIQKQSREFDEGLAKIGQFINTSTGTVRDELAIVPIVCKLEWIEFSSESNDIEFSTEDEAEAKERFGEEHWRYKQLKYIVWVAGDDMPSLMIFKGKSYKSGTKLYQLAKSVNPKCLFSRAYTVKSEMQPGHMDSKVAVTLINVHPKKDGLCDERGFLTKDIFDLCIEFSENL